MKRRHFLHTCAATAVLTSTAGQRVLANGGRRTAYERAQLVDAGGEPVTASGLDRETAYIFHYPYAATPAFLLRLGTAPLQSATVESAQGESYRWPGGVGPDGAVVAFCAICPHQLTYPKRGYTLIGYQESPSETAGQPRTVTCCTHRSAFDVTHGGSVVAGPAPQPLTTIVLERDSATDGLYATATLGPEVYDAFFKAYRAELRDAYGAGNVHRPVRGQTTVQRLDRYTGEVIPC